MLTAKALIRRYGLHAPSYVERLIGLAVFRNDDIGAFELLALLDAVEQGLANAPSASDKGGFGQ